jgi:uncharacterized sulfatase
MPPGLAIDGRDLMPTMTGGRVPDAPLFWNSGYYRAVRAGDWKLQVNARQGRAWLHNLAEDPTERINLAEREAAKRAELEALLARHQAGRRAALYPSTFDTAVALDRTLAEPHRAADEIVYWPN